MELDRSPSDVVGSSPATPPPKRHYSYEEAMSSAIALQRDLRAYDEENYFRPDPERGDSKDQIRRQIVQMREKLEALTENAPDAWGETADGFAAAMAELAEHCRPALRMTR